MLANLKDYLCFFLREIEGVCDLNHIGQSGKEFQQERLKQQKGPFLQYRLPAILRSHLSVNKAHGADDWELTWGQKNAPLPPLQLLQNISGQLIPPPPKMYQV